MKINALEHKANKIFTFFQDRISESIRLYYDQEFSEYYIVIPHSAYKSQTFTSIIGEYMRSFDDISYITVISDRYINVNRSSLNLITSGITQGTQQLVKKVKSERVSHWSFNDIFKSSKRQDMPLSFYPGSMNHADLPITKWNHEAIVLT